MYTDTEERAGLAEIVGDLDNVALLNLFESTVTVSKWRDNDDRISIIRDEILDRLENGREEDFE